MSAIIVKSVIRLTVASWHWTKSTAEADENVVGKLLEWTSGLMMALEAQVRPKLLIIDMNVKTKYCDHL